MSFSFINLFHFLLSQYHYQAKVDTTKIKHYPFKIYIKMSDKIHKIVLSLKQDTKKYTNELLGYIGKRQQKHGSKKVNIEKN